MSAEEIRFSSGDGECVGRLFRASAEGPGPAVVLCTGFSCVRDQGLDAAASRLASAGFTALAFDYRHWGDSPGEPRALMSAARQRQDVLAALATTRELDGVDPERVALWGFSLGTGHLQELATSDSSGIAAIVLVAPLVSGVASLRHLGGPMHPLRLFAAGIRDVSRDARGAGPYRVAAVGPPGSMAVLNSPDSEPGMGSVTSAGSSWVNEACARAALAPPYMLFRKVRRIAVPALYCVFEDDDVNPPKLATRASEAAPRGELRTYPGGHFAAFGDDLLDRVIGDQVEFLGRHLGNG